MDLNNKVAVVTGGASGLGRAAAQELSDRGATLVIIDMNAEAGAKAVTELLAAKGLKRGENDLKVIMMCEVPVTRSWRTIFWPTSTASRSVRMT